MASPVARTSETLSVTSVTEKVNNDSLIPNFLKNISNSDLLLCVGFCILMLVVILLYLYFKNSSGDTPSDSNESVSTDNSVHNLHRQPKQIKQIKQIKQTKQTKLIHPKLSESDESLESSELSESDESPVQQKTRLSQYDLTNSEIGEINDKLKKVDPNELNVEDSQ